MSDNPQVSPDSFFRLGFGVLAVSGPDAVKFLHAQCMSDVAALAPGQWQWSGWLTPKGRVIALFALLKLDERTLWLVPPDADATALAERLRRFVFRSTVAIDELDLGAEGGARCLRIARAAAPDDAAALARWMRFDLAHGLPRLPADQAEQW